MAAAYPPERVEALLVQIKLPPSYRIIPDRYLATPLGTAPADSRFCARHDGFTVLYAAADFATAFIETVVRDRFVRRQQREVRLKEVTARAWVYLETLPGAWLNLLDLRQDGCIRLGAPTDAINARHHGAGSALGRMVHAEHRRVDGLIFPSRLTGADVYALFDRSLGRLQVLDWGALAWHPDLPAVLQRHAIVLVSEI